MHGMPHEMPHETPNEIPVPPANDLHAELLRYRQRWPREAGVVEAFRRLLDDRADPFVRSRLEGHFTASSWLVDRSGTRVLLTHHRKLGRWLQLGGHADGDRDLPLVALREAQEESGLEGLRVDRELFDLDRHWIPGRGDVPAHWHYDARYVVHAGDDEDYIVSEESLALAWRGIEAIARLGDSGAAGEAGAVAADGAIDAGEAVDPSLQRMARKWLGREVPGPASPGPGQRAPLNTAPGSARCPGWPTAGF